MTLYQELKNELENHSGFWNYYDGNFDDVFMDESTTRDFIYNYFKGGSKLYAIGTWVNTMNEYTQMRNIHTVNVFFIGALLQRIIDDKIAIRSAVSYDYSFSYIWYLTCLAHDLGYVYENYSTGYLKIPDKRDYRRCYRYNTMSGPKFLPRKRWYQEHGIDITYSVPAFGIKSSIAHYSQNKIHNSDGGILYNNGTVVKKPRYSGETKNNYFYYRLYEMETLDHGIVGADEFFSKLMINYVREYRIMASRDSFRDTFYEFHNEQGLHFCSEQFKIFAYIADCIASHNMYKADDNDISKSIYANYSLKCLLPDKFETISYKDNPLLFILCVADTIEPSKRFSGYSNVELLKSISIDYNMNSNTLHVEVDENLYGSDEGQRYVSDIEKLEEWCDIKTTVSAKKV